MENEILTIEECEEIGIYIYYYKNGDYQYQDKEGYLHLIRNGFDLLKGKKAKDSWSYVVGDYYYNDSKGYYHLIRDDIDLLKGKDAKYCYSYNNGYYKYEDSEGKWHYIKKEPKT